MTVCEIVENELILNSSNFDIEQTATRFTIRQSDNTIALALEVRAPDALLLNQYLLHTQAGDISIGKHSVLDGTYRLEHPDEPPRYIEKMGLRFTSGGGSVYDFISSAFISPKGIDIDFQNGGVIFGSVN